MNKTFKNFYLIFLLAIALCISVSGQTVPPQKNIETNTLTNDVTKISELIPIKEGTTLKKMDSAGNAEKLTETERAEIPVSKQTKDYVRPTSKQRFKRYLNNMVGTGLIGVGASSVIGQISESPPEWEQNGEGFLRRVGSNFGKQVISESVSYGLEETLKLDSKFYKSKKKDFGSRVKNAFLSSFTARTPSGKRVFNPSRIAGRYTGNIIATETWYPKRYSYKDGFRQGTRGIGFNIGLNFLREFVFPK